MRIFRLAAALASLPLLTLAPAIHAQNALSPDLPGVPPPPAPIDSRFIDKSADPCVNFAQYACGKFPSVYPIPSDMASYGTGAIVFERTEAELHILLDKMAANNPSRTPAEQKVGDFYASCMDTAAIESRGLKPLQPELDRIAAIKDKSELTAILAHFQLINANAFLGYGEQQDFKDARKQIAAVDQGGLGLPERDYYLRTGDAAEKTRKEYVEHVANMLRLIGESDTQATDDAHRIMDLETTLAKASMDITSERDPHNIYHPMSVSDLEKLTPVIDWPKFFAATGAPSFTELNVTNPEFFKALQTLIESTGLDTIKAYLRWQYINSLPSYALPAKLDDEDFAFFGHDLRGQPEQRARYKRCAQATDSALGEAIGQVYVKTYFPPENKVKTVQMVQDIENAMDKEIDTLDWMSPETKVKAKAKLHMVADKIGYPDHFRDYSALKIVRGDALGNAIRAVEFENHRQISKIGKPVDRGEWGMSPSTVNAYYNPSMNDINFPAAILQAPFYSPNATDAENYGHAGAIIGHELTHGFDDEGSQFNGSGDLSNWWTPGDQKNFEAMTDCEVKEYGNFTAVDDLKVNGKLTLGENTADNGGLRLALRALEIDARRKGIDLEAKDSSGLTPIQQFFLSYGQDWCGENRPAQIRLQVQTDPHSPREFRILGVVQNMPEFGKAFGCKPGQPMMPTNACHVW